MSDSMGEMLIAWYVFAKEKREAKVKKNAESARDEEICTRRELAQC